jgi:hypothetical protein
MPKNELLPCPFCGQEAIVGIMLPSSYWSIGCTNSDTTKCFIPFHENRYKTKKLAIIAWNTRVTNEK